MMEIKANNHAKGFTLLEMLLVVVIVGMLIYASIAYMQQRTLQMRIDGTVIQMQSVLNAALTYYVQTGNWPVCSTAAPVNCWAGHSGDPLIAYNFSGLSPFGSRIAYGSNPCYSLGGSSNACSALPPPYPSYFYVYTNLGILPSGWQAIAQTVAGQLPMGVVTGGDAASGASQGTGPQLIPTTACTQNACYAVGAVSAPGYALNNATAVNFAGLYHHGACVPVPPCPMGPNGVTMTPNIIVVPVSLSGVNDSGSLNAYPISSFTATALPQSPSSGPPTLNNTPPSCETQTTATSCQGTNDPPGTNYWRVCVSLTTEKGPIYTPGSSGAAGSGNLTYGKYVTVAAFTRCAISNEPSGSNFTIYETES